MAFFYSKSCLLVGTGLALIKGMENLTTINRGETMCKVTLINGKVIEAKIVKAVKACPSPKMAVWYDDGRCTTSVVRVSRGKYEEVV